ARARRERVVAGEYWRLLTAPWLHGSTEHLIGNGIALYILGMMCEAAFGPVQFIVLYVLSGLAGSLVSVLVSAGPSVGASGAIFGLQGAAIVLLRRERARLVVPARRGGFAVGVLGVRHVLAAAIRWCSRRCRPSAPRWCCAGLASSSCSWRTRSSAGF